MKWGFKSRGPDEPKTLVPAISKVFAPLATGGMWWRINEAESASCVEAACGSQPLGSITKELQGKRHDMPGTVKSQSIFASIFAAQQPAAVLLLLDLLDQAGGVVASDEGEVFVGGDVLQERQELSRVGEAVAF